MLATAFERYGGFAAISKVVMAFYERVLDSDEIGDFFESVDMRRLVDHQTKFIVQAMGGPVAYTDRQLQQVHAHLSITPAHFAEMVRLLEETLQDHGFDPEDVDLVVAAVRARAPAVITAPPAA